MIKKCDHHKKRHRSIFLKLLVLVILSWITMHIVFAVFFHRAIKSHANNVIHHIFLNNANYIIKDIGLPFDTLKASNLMKKLPLELIYKDSSFVWASNNKLRDNKDIFFSNKKNDRCYFHFGRIYVTLEKNGATYQFRTDIKKSFKNFSWLTLWKFFFLLLLLFIIMYIIIRKILQPIKGMVKGVKKVTEGNLDYKIPITSCDELSDFAESFNSMTTKIKDMVKSKEQLLLDVSHEMRSPLTRAKVASEFIDDESTRTSIVADLSEMDTMIGELLESERLTHIHGKLDLDSWSLKEIILDVVTLYNKDKELIKTDIPVDFQLSVDRNRILTLLKNIIENGLKYSNVEKDSLEISVKKVDNKIRLFIKDYGIGIPKEEVSFVFEPFYRIDKSRSKKTGGYGLGMSLCKKIMEAHKGSIEIESELEKGTTVILIFNEV